ncbi:ABC transporter substrate-binding protein [Kribbella solani]|uniref:Peptide/nickel transport system substrate-binding protein n=1 Tax=Kribbella solani TaxID=236067 RepID=A0A841DQP7_9ACTN|nr:ABC transporter substrate-binding protein [Kribbella solani]MBB5980892.1 peptide/nickel transport system substrate-binding protein [Kribbella solani]
MSVVAAVGCSQSTPGNVASRAVRVVSSQIPVSLDPARAVAAVDSTAGSNFYVALTRYGTRSGPDGTKVEDPTKVEPYLAGSWQISPDGKTYDFKLKPGLKFASGAPVDAAAVVYSFKRLLASPGAYYITAGIDGLIKAVTATDDYTVRFVLSQPQPAVLKAWGTAVAAIVDPTVVSSKPKDWLSNHEAGSGPFQLKSYQPGQSLTMVRRPGFEEWAGWTTDAEEVDISYVGDDSSLLLKARSAADVTVGLSNQAADSLRTGSKAIRVVGFDAPLFESLLLSWSRPPFNSLAVRRALTLAVPYDDLLKGPGAGRGQRFYGPIPANIPGYDRALGAPAETNVAEAKRILEKAGVSIPVKATITVDQGSTTEQQLAQIIQSEAKEAGFDFEIRVLTSSQYSEVIYGDGFEAVLRVDSPAVADAGFFLGYSMAYKQPGGFSNPGLINIPKADELLAQARATQDKEKQSRLYSRITELWNAQAPAVPLFTVGQSVALSNSLKSFKYTLGNTMAMYEWGLK